MHLHKTSSRLDKIGVTASTICAIHCAVVPVFITSLPLLGMGFLATPWIEWGMILFALMIGVYSIGGSYVKVHRSLLPLILLIAGFGVIVLGHLFLNTGTERYVVPLGGLLIAIAHVVNQRYVGACSHES
ncbi:MerC domain-containing protein [Mucilaginibacter flavus]|uniref:MerC domain-containing protein n=1 Tax=Mucilaginibacter flavus TaxID=931504 RepID=UPI0025B379C7|nr:MerC domain-containing protein [Mucilaginibacter flavus]MDN3579938.1 MerC domain-containing protein [Mucilaginibacter flavus]